MNAIHDKLKVLCKDTEHEYEILYPEKYKVTNNKIIIRTSVKNSDLRRGWIGDLFCDTTSRDVCDYNIIIAQNTEDIYKDVLLAYIDIIDVDGSICWKYVFLKK